MRAVALVAPGQVEVVDDWPEPAPGSDDVVVRIRGVGLCGSDLSVFDGSRQVPGMPWVFGHEGGGDIVALGSGVRDREIGQCFRFFRFLVLLGAEEEHRFFEAGVHLGTDGAFLNLNPVGELPLHP